MRLTRKVCGRSTTSRGYTWGLGVCSRFYTDLLATSAECWKPVVNVAVGADSLHTTQYKPTDIYGMTDCTYTRVPGRELV